MNRDPCAYSVYAYVFDDGHTYIGLTKDPKKRALGHKSGKSTVFRFWTISGRKDFPIMLVLYDGMSSSEAQRTEDILVNCIELAKRLNKAATGVGSGSLGGGNADRTEVEQRRAKEHKRERNRAYSRAYYWKHHEQALVKNKAYRQSHRERKRELERSEKYREYQKVYRKNHRRDISRKNEEYRRAHLEKFREWSKVYASLH